MIQTHDIYSSGQFALSLQLFELMSHYTTKSCKQITPCM
uniref:Uncharacterized protein n=1 Tax=Heterorhabditis bacteriophora TaxID=37862 RepID=A0A1I7WQQ0_HETBA